MDNDRNSTPIEIPAHQHFIANISAQRHVGVLLLNYFRVALQKEMSDFRRGISPFVLVLALAGCADNTKPIDLRIGLFVADEVKLSARLHNPCRGIKEEPSLDRDLESTMTRAFRRLFTSVHVLESDPAQQMMDDKQLDLVVIAKLMGTGGGFGYQGEGLWNRGESDYSMSVKLTFYTHEMKQVTSMEMSGAGSAESIGILSDGKHSAFVKSVKSAIRNLGDDIVHQVHVNPDIRNIAEQSRK